MRTLKRPVLLGAAVLGAFLLGLCSALPLALARTGTSPLWGMIPGVVLGAFLGRLLLTKGPLLRERMGSGIPPRPETADLLRREQNLRQILASSMTAVSIHQEGRIVYRNQAYEDLMGPLSGLFETTGFEYIYPEDQAPVRAFHERLTSRQDDRADVEFRFWPVDGSGGRLGLKWVHCRGSHVLYDGKEGLLFNFMDITGIREMDRLMSRQDRMTSLGRVAAAITHEIRNALSSINIYLHTLEKAFAGTEGREKEKEIIEQIKRSSNQIESIVKTVRDFSRPGAIRLERCGINACAETAVEICSNTLGKNGIQVERLLDPGIPSCSVDRTQIQRVIVNLILNAVDALQATDRDRRRLQIATFAEADSIGVRVSDSGPGIPMHLRGMVFEPFFSSKEDSTGIGLTICQRIIKDHDGIIYCRDSELGGVEFVIELPAGKRTED